MARPPALIPLRCVALRPLRDPLSSPSSSSLASPSPHAAAPSLIRQQHKNQESAQGARSCDLEGNRAGLAASSTSEMLCRSQWSRSAGLSECNHVAVAGWTT